MVPVSKLGLELFAIWLGFVCVLGDRRRHIVVQSGFAGMLALFLNYVITQFYFEPRPFVSHPVHLLFPHAADASFPSDHTSGAFALALTVLIRKRRFGWWGYIMLALASRCRA
ncbi:phosphatase PAP2 family protein [Cohnella lubricantis]|uniref:phosphatase PAP2 family protein n=1 Tax=Cohnella lubricantis TaxID=2163172 RepID=UPI0035E08491